MSKKLLVVGSNSIHTYNFIALVADYFDEVLLLTNQKNSDYLVESREIDFHLGISSLSSIRQIRAIAKEFNPTIVHIHQANSYALLTLLALREFNCQKILTAWGSDILISPQKSFILKFMAKYILKRVDIVTADSNIVLEKADELVDRKLDTYNINFGIDIQRPESEKENIIYSNRLHKSLYNIDKIIISFAKLIAIDSSWRLIIAGIGEQTKELKRVVDELSIGEKVEFVGWVDHATNYNYYSKAKIYISIPQSDSISLSLVESIICGCIPFVSDLPANRELVDMSMGFIVDDIENIPFLDYQQIDKEVFDKRAEEIAHNFSKEVNRQKYLNLYKRADEN